MDPLFCCCNARRSSSSVQPRHGLISESRLRRSAAKKEAKEAKEAKDNPPAKRSRGRVSCFLPALRAVGTSQEQGAHGPAV